MPYSIRPCDLTLDLARIVELVNTINPEPVREEAFRGRHLALALKLLSIAVAQRYHVDYLYTNNDSTNAPMLAINRRLGYHESPGIHMLIRPLETGQMNGQS